MNKPEECESCHFETSALTMYEDRLAKPDRREMWFCELCAGTMAGIHARNGSYPDQGLTLQTICYVGNVILDTIRKRASGEDQ